LAYSFWTNLTLITELWPDHNQHNNALRRSLTERRSTKALHWWGVSILPKQHLNVD
jgi:hypothetical protein